MRYLTCFTALLTITSLFLTQISVVKAQKYSGVYTPDLESGSHDFAAAWLISKARFQGIKNYLSSISNMAGVTFAAVRQTCPNCLTLVTRDYFDFMVQHLSTASNQIPGNSPALIQDMVMRLKTTSEIYRNSAQNNLVSTVVDLRQNYTLAVLIFSSVAFSSANDKNGFQSTIRQPFFEVTFWSTYRYFPNIAIFVATQEDWEYVKAMNLPYWRLFKLLNVPVKNNQVPLLPRHAMDYLLSQIPQEFNMLYQFDYIYYSEGDQVVHIRHIDELYRAIDENLGMTAVVPHRMQTLPLAQDFDPSLRQFFPDKHALNIHNASIRVEHSLEARGSCCDAGRYIIAPCKNGWWYQCEDWGLQNMSPWMKFGDSGFTFVPSSAHKGKCQYSGNRRTCPIPHGCRARVPRKKGRGGVKAKKFGFDPKTLCGMIRDIEVLGPAVGTATTVATTATTTAVVRAVNKKMHYSRRQTPQDSEHGTFIMSSTRIPPSNQSNPEEVAIDKELEKLLTAEHELQHLLTDVVKLRRKIKHGQSSPTIQKNV